MMARRGAAMLAPLLAASLLAIAAGFDELDFEVPYPEAAPLSVYPSPDGFMIFSPGSKGATGVSMGAKQGDRLVGVNGEPLSTLSFYTALQGKPNTTVVLPLVEESERAGPEDATDRPNLLPDAFRLGQRLLLLPSAREVRREARVEIAPQLTAHPRNRLVEGREDGLVDAFLRGVRGSGGRARPLELPL